MQPLLDQTIGTKNENLKSKIFRILTFAIAIASLIMSITGLSFANKVFPCPLLSPDRDTLRLTCSDTSSPTGLASFPTRRAPLSPLILMAR